MLKLMDMSVLKLNLIIISLIVDEDVQLWVILKLMEIKWVIKQINGKFILDYFLMINLKKIIKNGFMMKYQQ